MPSANQHGSRPGIDLARPFVRDELSRVDALPELVETSTPEVRGPAPLSDLAVEKHRQSAALLRLARPRCGPQTFARSIDSGASGTRGTTSTAPTRGWTPTCSRRSMRSTAAAMPASERLDQVVLLGCEREDRTVVVGIRVGVEEQRVPAEGRADRRDRPRLSALPTRWARPRARSVPYEAVPDEEPRSTPDSGWRTFVRLLGFLRPYRASLAVSSLLAILSQIAGVLVPVLTGVVINEVSGDADTQLLLLEVGAIILLGLVRGALMYGRRVISGRQALGSRVRHARRAVLALPPTVVRLLRPQSDRPAHVARHDRPAVRALLPRLRPHLLRAARRHDPRRHGACSSSTAGSSHSSRWRSRRSSR